MFLFVRQSPETFSYRRCSLMVCSLLWCFGPKHYRREHTKREHHATVFLAVSVECVLYRIYFLVEYFSCTLPQNVSMWRPPNKHKHTACWYIRSLLTQLGLFSPQVFVYQLRLDTISFRSIF